MRFPGEVLRQRCSGDAATSGHLKENGASLLFSFKVRQTGIFISGSCRLLLPEQVVQALVQKAVDSQSAHTEIADGCVPIRD